MIDATDMARVASEGSRLRVATLAFGVAPDRATEWLEQIATAGLADGEPEALAQWLLEVRGLAEAGQRSLVRLLLSGGYARQLPAPLAGRLAQLAVARGETDAVRAFVRELRPAAAAHPEVVRALLQSAQAEGDTAAVSQLLTRLTALEPTAAALIAAHRQRATLEPDAATDIRVGVLGTYTLEVVSAAVDLEVRRLGLRPHVVTLPFGAVGQQLLTEGSELQEFDPQLLLLSVALDDLAPTLAGPVDAAGLAAIADRAIDEMTGFLAAFVERYSGHLVLTSFWSDHIGRAILDWQPTGSARWLQELNGRLAALVDAQPRVHLLDAATLFGHRAGGAASDPKMRYLAGMRLTADAAHAAGRAVARFVVPIKGLTKKCLVLDLDNTLWGGIVGEDGPDGIRLGNTSPGIEYHDFQLAIARIAKRGVLLAVNSKNNPDDAMQVLQSHPWMVLRPTDFSAMRINWQSKVENLREIAKELNIGIDSLVFVDDNPVECEQVRQLLPEVTTVQLPTDASRYRTLLEELPWFDAFQVTAEDLKRAESYKANRERDSLRTTVGTVDEYLKSLEIRMEIGPVDVKTAGRAAQLLERTNQFNLTTRRHALADIERWRDDPRYLLRFAKVADRFGDHGLVALAIARAEGTEWVIDSMLMSCRVIGQGIEQALLSHIVEAAAARGATRVVGEFLPTKKNGQVREFYARAGFAPLATDAEGGATFALALPAAIPVPRWLEVTAR